LARRAARTPALTAGGLFLVGKEDRLAWGGAGCVGLGERKVVAAFDVQPGLLFSLHTDPVL